MQSAYIRSKVLKTRIRVVRKTSTVQCRSRFRLYKIKKTSNLSKMEVKTSGQAVILTIYTYVKTTQHNSFICFPLLNSLPLSLDSLGNRSLYSTYVTPAELCPRTPYISEHSKRCEDTQILVPVHVDLQLSVTCWAALLFTVFPLRLTASVLKSVQWWQQL